MTSTLNYLALGRISQIWQCSRIESDSQLATGNNRETNELQTEILETVKEPPKRNCELVEESLRSSRTVKYKFLPDRIIPIHSLANDSYSAHPWTMLTLVTPFHNYFRHLHFLSNHEVQAHQTCSEQLHDYSSYSGQLKITTTLSR